VTKNIGNYLVALKIGFRFSSYACTDEEAMANQRRSIIIKKIQNSKKYFFRKSESVRNGRSRSRDSRPSKSSKHVSPAQKRIVKQERRSRSSSKPSRSKSPKKSVKQQKSKKDAKKKSKRKRKSSTSSSSNSSSDSEVESKQPRKVTSRIEHSNGIEFIDNDMTFKEALKNQGKRDKNIAREVKQDMSITKARQMILHLYEKSGEKPIFEHVDCSKLPQNPESAPQSTSVAGGNLLAAMFGTADDEEEELQGDSSEPEKLREKKAELAKTEKPRGTTGIAINDRITWWQKMVAKKSDVKTTKKAKKAKKKKRKVSESESSESDEKYSPVKNEKKDSRKSSKSRKSSRKQSPSIKKERRSRSRSMSISRSPSPVRRRSPAKRRRSPARRRSLSRSISRSRSPSRRRESRSGSESMDEARKPCVFYFSKNAQGCRFSGRECKFSHDKYDYDYWNRSGRDLPNTGLIERTKPLRDNRRSYTPDRRRY